MSSPDGSTAADPMIGQQLGKDYQVLECIGVGGMGVVYMVEHTALRKRFAAKVLAKELAADAEARGRFQAEAHAASQLEHENIINLTDYGLTADGRPYLIMEFLRGRTLDQRLAEGPLSLEEIVAIVIPVARGLAEAHREGIVHRDVKPENVFLTQRSGGRWGVKVLDFGIAKTPVRGNRLTKTGQALGSPMYMAPEACRGDEVDHRADIYSLGVLMYLLWCGRVPFDDDNLLKILQMQVSDPVPPPRALNPDISPAIEAVILRALEKEPDHRFLSLAVLLAELEAALPDGADQLLIEAARGTTSMRALSEYGATPYPARAVTTRPIRPTDPTVGARVARSPSLVGLPVRTPSGTRADDPVDGRPRRRGLLAGALVAGVAVVGLAIALWPRAEGRTGGAGAREATTPAITPSSVTPPAVTSPAVAPPAVTPPAVAPPAVTSPAVAPPAMTPPPVVPPPTEAVVTPPVAPSITAPPVAPPTTRVVAVPRTTRPPRPTPVKTTAGSKIGSGSGSGSGSGAPALGIRTRR